jgi:hypothetical protein
VGELGPDLKLTESIAAEWKLSSQSKQINNPRPKIGLSILQLLNSCNITRAGGAMVTWFSIECLRNIHG